LGGKKKSKMEQRKKGSKPSFFRNNTQGQPVSKEPRMTETMGQRPRKQPMKCWGCNGDHMYQDCPHRDEKVRVVHNVQQVKQLKTWEKCTKDLCSPGQQAGQFQSHMVEVEGKINNQPIAILIDSGASHSYLDPKMVERFQLPKRKLGKPWLVQLATGAKRKINEMVKACPMNMNGMNTKEDLNIIPLGSYDCLIGMDWMDKHHVVLDCYNKSFTCLDEEGNLRKYRVSQEL
jgi:hypothetical protein